MPLLETLAITIGYAIAKTLVVVWLDKDSLEATISLSIIELLKKETPNYFAARQVERQFDEIGDRVSHSLEPIFNSYNLDEATQNAVAEEVSQTINEATISSHLLVKLNYDPIKLLSYIKEKYPQGGKLFSEVESALYNRALDLAVQHIVDIAPHFSDYSSRNFAELLQRTDGIMSKVDEILKNVERLRVTSEIAKEFSQFEQEYRTIIARRFDYVDLLGVDLPRSIKRYSLTVSYVSLYVDDMEFDKEISIEEALSSFKKSIIVGEAGSGKSTLLRWLAVNTAKDTLGSELREWSGSVPIFVELRRFLEGPPTPIEIVNNTAPDIADRLPSEWLQEVLKDGRVLLLVDGLDEVPPEKRSDIHEWLEDFVAAYPNIRVVLTSRPLALQDDWLDFLGFRKLTLDSMRIQQIENFVEYWHRAVLGEHGLESQEKIQTLVTKLLTKFRNSTPLMHLSKNPLLCAMICALHYYRRMHLPNERNTLYEACCSMLLDRRDAEREVPVKDPYNITYKQKRLLLDDLAYWMIKNGYSSVSWNQAVERIEYRLHHMQLDKSKIDGNTLLEILVERSGVLRHIPPDSVDFIHKTFQEYMAASAAAYESDWGLLQSKAANDQWQETIVLAAGFANREIADELIRGLLTLGKKNNQRRSYYDLLAMSCLETIVEISADVRIMVEERVSVLIPPKNREVSKSLASVGDLAVPYLVHNDDYSASEAVACVDVLGAIGTQEALNKLGTYAVDHRPKVIKAVEEVLKLTAPEDVASSGLSKSLLHALGEFVTNEELSLTGVLLYSLSDESSLVLREAILPDVKKLSVSQYTMRASVFLSDLFPNVEEAVIAGSLLANLELIVGLKHLAYLEIMNADYEWPNLGPLRSLDNLRCLRVVSFSDFWPNFGELAYTHIQELTLYCELGIDFPELDELVAMDQLRYLHLAAKRGLWPNLDILARLPALEVLELSSGSGLDHFTFHGLIELSHLKQLKVNLPNIQPHVTSKLKEIQYLMDIDIKLTEDSLEDRLHSLKFLDA